MPETELPPPNRPWATTGMEGRGPNIVYTLYLPPDKLEAHCNRLFAKYREIEAKEKRSVKYLTEDAEILVVAYGIMSRVAKAAVEMAREEGIKAGLFRPITLWPFPDTDLEEAAARARVVIAAEISMGQMIEDVRLALGKRVPVYLFNRIGRVPNPDEIYEDIKAKAQGVMING